MVTANQIPNSSDGNSKRKKKPKKLNKIKIVTTMILRDVMESWLPRIYFGLQMDFFFYYYFFGSVYKSGEALWERVQIEIRV